MLKERQDLLRLVHNKDTENREMQAKLDDNQRRIDDAEQQYSACRHENEEYITNSNLLKDDLE